MIKFCAYLLVIGIAFGLGVLAGYATFTLPSWAMDQTPASMVGWGWITGLPAVVVMTFVTIGVFAALRRIFIT